MYGAIKNPSHLIGWGLTLVASDPFAKQRKAWWLFWRAKGAGVFIAYLNSISVESLLVAELTYYILLTRTIFVKLVRCNFSADQSWFAKRSKCSQKFLIGQLACHSKSICNAEEKATPPRLHLHIATNAGEMGIASKGKSFPLWGRGGWGGHTTRALGFDCEARHVPLVVGFWQVDGIVVWLLPTEETKRTRIQWKGLSSIHRPF